jgi:hypothetical protein
MSIKTIAIAAGVLAVATVAAGTSASAAQLLGCQKVGFVKDTDVISVGKDDGKFKAIQLRVSGNEIDMQDLKVIYGNGEVDDLQVRSQIKAGGETRWIDLKGNKRFIKEVRMVYKSKPSFKGQATVCAYGR